MRCELKKMGRDVKKSVTLKNILGGVVLIAAYTVVAITLAIAVVVTMGYVFGINHANEIMESSLPWAQLLTVIFWCSLFYSWYKKSHEWCNNRGD